MSDQNSKLLEQATPEELANLKNIKRRRDAARTEHALLAEKSAALSRAAGDLAQQIEKAATTRKNALVAQALGEGDAPPPAEPAPDTTPAEMREAAAVLAARAQAKAKEAEAEHGHLRAGVLELAEACAQRLGFRYVEKSKELAEIHAGIAGAQRLMEGAGIARRLVFQEWDTILIPLGEGLDAMKNAGRLRGSDHQRLPLLGGLPESLQKAANGAAFDAKAEIRALLGGEWPLDRS